MSISIVIPTYNRAGLIHRAIESVLQQTNPGWELIIVDDGSTDKTSEIVKKYLSTKVQYVKQNNAGANRARNEGARIARSSYLTFLDSDDELFPTWVEEFLKELYKNPSIVCCGTLRIENGQERKSMPKSMGRIFDQAVGKFTNGACYAIHKELFFSIGGFDEDLRSGQHTELSFRLAEMIVSKQISLINIPKALVRIHVHDGPRIRNSSESKFRGAYHMLQKHSTLMAKYPKVKKNYAKIVSYHAFKQHYFGVAFKSFITYCKYALIAKFQR